MKSAAAVGAGAAALGKSGAPGKSRRAGATPREIRGHFRRGPGRHDSCSRTRRTRFR
ncbi:hypothetical protein [Nocardia sp. NPDC057668]|uniref:hypothetical protein n=1 Tax=Nocardia sp. NPDC057668 TaxID=3346202 RepID=UPI00366F9E06